MKGLKRLAVAVAVILVVLSLSALVSCGGDTSDSTEPSTNNSTTPTTDGGNSSTTDSTGGDSNTDKDNPNLVTVKVVDQNGKGISGANIQICQGETCFFKPIITGTDGVGSREYELNGERLKAKVNSIDSIDDYIVPGTMGYVYFSNDARELTIVIKKVTVEVFDQDGKGVEAAKINLYQGTEKFTDSLVTDADGIATGFIASNGEEISAAVTEVMSGGSYKLSKEATPFGIGSYEGTITVNKLSAYTVKVTTMLGKNIANFKVELYDAEKNRKQKTEYTDENGMVKFENVEPGEYYVKVSHESPAYVIINEAVDGKYMFGNGTSIILEAVDLPEIQYSVTLSDKAAGLYVSLINKNNEVVSEGATDENGTAYLTAPNGSYVAVVSTSDGTYYSPVYFEYDKTASGTSTKADGKAGSSKETPILLYSASIGFDFTANEAVWFKVLNAHKKILNVTAEGGYKLDLYVGDEVDSDSYSTGDNVFKLDTADGVIEYICITPSEAGYAYVYTTAPGTFSAPFEITEVGTYDYMFESGASIYYTFTADSDTVLSVTANGLSVLFNWEEGVLDGESYLYPVKAGDTVTIIITNYDEEIFTDVTFSTGSKSITYTVTVYQSGSVAEGIKVLLYKSTENGLELVGEYVTDADGAAAFEADYRLDYVIKAEFPEGFTFVGEEEVYLGASNLGYYYIDLIRTGEVDLPYEFDIIEGEETAIVPENGVVWYTINVRPGNSTFILTANSENAVIVIYYGDTNEDGRVDMNDDRVGVSVVKNGVAEYKFTTNNRLYKVAVMTADASAEEIELTYTQKEAGEGETPDTAIEISESTTVSESVNGTVYYRFTGDACKLTITVSEGVTLQRVTLSLDEDPVIENAPGNTITVDDTMGDWIYFAITGEGEYQLSVDVE